MSGQGAVYYNQTSGSATYSGSINITGSASTGGHLATAAGGELLISGPITSSALITMRSGLVTLSNANNSFSALSLQGSTCKIGVGNAIPAGTTVDMGANGSATLDLNGFSPTLGALTKGSTNTANVVNVINSSAGTPTLTIDNAGAVSFPGALGGSATSFNLTKTSAGMLTLSGTNTYTGATLVSAGTLNASNSVGSATGSGNVTVASVGALMGNGTISGAVALSGTVAPGNGVGTLSTGSETWTAGGHYSWEINSAAGTAGVNPGWDRLNITGALNITATSGSKFNLDITSLTSTNTAGAVSDFNSSSNYTWSIVHTTTGITGFDPNAFALNTSAFNNSIGTGSFSLSANATDILLTFTAGTSAQPPASFITTTAGQGSFSGSPNTSYTVQYTTDLNSPVNWQTLATVITDNAGHGTFSDASAPNGQPARFYRVKNP